MQSESTVMEPQDIVTSLLDKDGSCRDVNFEGPTWVGVENMLTSLESDFGAGSGTDLEGEPLLTPLQASALAAARRGYAHLVLTEGIGILSNLQVLISRENDGSPFVELTFFPDDVRQTSSLRDEFVTWANTLQLRLGARRYYARYENASWHFGDISAESGVFLVSDDFA